MLVPTTFFYVDGGHRRKLFCADGFLVPTIFFAA
jgi:hypothetical protein